MIVNRENWEMKKQGKEGISSLEGEGGQTSNEFRDLYENTLKQFSEGQIVMGKVVAIWNKEALIDIGYKSEGLLPLEEFSDPSNVKVGDEIEVLFESVENEEGMVVLSKKKADRLKYWNQILVNATEGSIVEGKIFKRVPGGFMVDIGLEAFLPASLVDIRPTRNLDHFLGGIYKFKIVKINEKRKNIVLSRKDYLEQEKEQLRIQFLSTLKEGQKVRGRVKNITDFGAFVDLGGVDGLLHITDMSWGRVSHPSELLSIGQEVEVVISGFDRNNKRISLGLKQLGKDPWDGVLEKYPINSRLKGRVVNILPYGAFIELEKGVEGLVHVSELSWDKKIGHPMEVVQLGQEVEAVVLNVDRQARKIALGIKQIDRNPWDYVGEKYPVGARVEGKVKNLTEYGAFIELEPGVGGLLHISDMSWTKKVNHPSEVIKKGQTLNVIVLSVEAKTKKIALSLKHLDEDPWKEITKDLTAGSQINGKVTKIVNYGLFVELPGGIEGLLHQSEIPDPQAKKLKESFKIGDEMILTVLKVDEENRKIALSLKGKGGSKGGKKASSSE